MTEIILNGVFIMLGAFLGALLAGQFTLKSVKQQIEYDKKKQVDSQRERQEKFKQYLFTNLDGVASGLTSISFLLKEEDTKLNVYEIDYKKTVEGIILQIKKPYENIIEAGFDILSVADYKELQQVMRNINELEGYIQIIYSVSDEEIVKDFRDKALNICTKIFTEVNIITQEVKNTIETSLYEVTKEHNEKIKN